MTPERVGGLLLTGGSSRRMGRDKASLAFDHLTLAEHAAAVLTAVCSPCVEIGPGRSPLPSIQEVPPGAGPLAALAAGGHALRIEFQYQGPVVVLACDMPGVTPELLALIAAADTEDSVIPEAEGRLQPLCARYSPMALATADRLVESGERSMQSLLAAVPFRRLAEADWAGVARPDAFRDLDSPDDLATLDP